DMCDHASGKTLFVQDLYAGADENERIGVRVVTEFAWQALFIRHLLIVPPRDDLDGFTPDLTIIDLPSFNTDPARYEVRTETTIACDFTGGKILIAGTYYAGEIKKSVFTYLNYTLPAKDVMPMHCSANMTPEGVSALFFGLSGTGKTTLSADPARILVGDDEHGWGNAGIFNFEAGSYAKAINLSAEAEPQIYAGVRRFSTVLENVIIDEETREPDFDNDSLTENTRAAFPISFIDNASKSGCSGHPDAVIMLTCDAFGVMPPIARLTPSQAMYHFLSGYTAKVAGTEKGVVDPQATFSTCFGAPFLPRHPKVYGDLLRDMIARHGAKCWLVNTGWSGGRAGVGARMPIKVTRTLLSAALAGKLDNAEMRTDPYFGFEVPLEVEGIEAKLLDPRQTWDDGEAFDAQSRELVTMFQENFSAFETAVDAEVLSAAPKLAVAAE
ncbi:MAG: phosphoenolpyruvate carboxykinase (ATP), partial [Rhizobiales bacterium]|nr:phosphoenolpyruvate carboxykinase (ATP) [Hyphomicrobiales bacterium]